MDLARFGKFMALVKKGKDFVAYTGEDEQLRAALEDLLETHKQIRSEEPVANLMVAITSDKGFLDNSNQKEISRSVTARINQKIENIQKPLAVITNSLKNQFPNRQNFVPDIIGSHHAMKEIYASPSMEFVQRAANWEAIDWAQLEKIVVTLEGSIKKHLSVRNVDIINSRSFLVESVQMEIIAAQNDLLFDCQVCLSQGFVFRCCACSFRICASCWSRKVDTAMMSDQSIVEMKCLTEYCSGVFPFEIMKVLDAKNYKKVLKIAAENSFPSSVSSNEDDSVIEELLNDKCPECQMPIFDFDGCLALRCNRCKTEFCALCFTVQKEDCHAHVRKCTQADQYPSHGNENLFMSMDVWQVGRIKKKNLKLEQYLHEKVPNCEKAQLLWEKYRQLNPEDFAWPPTKKELFKVRCPDFANKKRRIE